MSVTTNLTNEEISQIKEMTHAEDHVAAVTIAAREYLRLRRLRELKAASGNVDFEDVSQRLEALEIEETTFPQ